MDMTTSERSKKMREKLDLTHHELGYILGINPEIVSKWEVSRNREHIPPDAIIEDCIYCLYKFAMSSMSKEFGKYLLMTFKFNKGFGMILQHSHGKIPIPKRLEREVNNNE